MTEHRRAANRVRRGDVRTAVMALLAEQDMHGYQIIQELAERSAGVWRPGAGSIYPTLRALQEQGYVRSRSEGSRRVFAITDYGRRTVQAAGGAEPWLAVRDAEGPRVRLREATEALLSALAQVAAGGGDAQAEGATAIVRAARKSVYLMLADEDA